MDRAALRSATRGGIAVDAAGNELRAADVAMSDDHVVEDPLGIDGRGIRKIDADRRTVTSGFVNIHAHCDGRATWHTDCGHPTSM